MHNEFLTCIHIFQFIFEIIILLELSTIKVFIRKHGIYILKFCKHFFTYNKIYIIQLKIKLKKYFNDCINRVISMLSIPKLNKHFYMDINCYIFG